MRGLFIGCVRRERSQQVCTLRKGSIEALNLKDAVHAVNAEIINIIAHRNRLSHKRSNGFAVNRKEQNICARLFCSGELGGKLGFVCFLKSSGINNVNTFGCRFGNEFFINAYGISIVASVNNGNGFADSVLGHIVRRADALVRVGEAHLEYMGFALNYLYGRCGRSEHKASASAATAAAGVEVTGPTSICIPQSIRIP